MKKNIKLHWMGCLLTLFFTFCSSKEVTNDAPPAPASASGVAEEDPCQPANQRWMEQFNSGSGLYDSIYFQRAVIVNAQGEVYDTPEGISNYHSGLANEFGGIRSIRSLHCIEVTPELSYNIGVFETAKGARFKQVVIWRTEKGKSRRELEFLAPASGTAADTAAINRARARWIALCNAHNASGLVSKLYTANAVYYNHKPVVVGTDAISEEYSYMNRPSYQLSLSPIAIEPVSDQLVYEIGQCSGSYKGKYLIVWQNTGASGWKVLLDSNK